MGPLVYNHATDRYEGDHVTVPAARFAVLLADLLADGVPAGEARRSLLEESIGIMGSGANLATTCLTHICR